MHLIKIKNNQKEIIYRMHMRNINIKKEGMFYNDMHKSHNALGEIFMSASTKKLLRINPLFHI